MFNNEINHYEIPLFRGAIINSVKESDNLLFHNHIENSFNYTYPRIQYKRIQGKASIVCVKEGTEAIGAFFSNNTHNIVLGDRPMELDISLVKPQMFRIQLWDSMFHYRLNRWLPLNSQNYIHYQQLESLTERIAFLEKILTANLLSFAKGVGVVLDEKVECSILELSEPFLIKNKGIKMMSFNLKFKTNLSIPNYIGLGKNASLGYGIVTEVRNFKSVFQ